jgi:hypothetical protein
VIIREMVIENYFNKYYITINYNKDSHVVVLKWLVTPTSTELREGSNATIAAIEHFKTGKLITDISYLKRLPPNDANWISKEWYAKASRAGCSHIAMISAEVFDWHHPESTIKIPTAYFKNIDTALQWIEIQG